MDNTLKERIEAEIKAGPVVIFMKGTPDFPMCGFSARACQILQIAGAPSIHGIDILDEAPLREGIKQYTQWPTLPQVFINGEFIGGCDLLIEMHESGELQKKLQSSLN